YFRPETNIRQYVTSNMTFSLAKIKNNGYHQYRSLGVKLLKRIISTSLMYWPVGQVVKTSPFHGGITGSNPVRVTICRSSSIGRATDLYSVGWGFKSSGRHIFCLQ